MRRLVSEVCPHCETDITGYFNTDLNHRETVCHECGRIVMLCSICPVKEKAFPCDRDQYGVCMMSRHKKPDHSKYFAALA